METAQEIRDALQGDTVQVNCNKEAGCYSRLWGRDCWVADSMLSLVQNHVGTLDDKATSRAVRDALLSITRYCDELRKQNRIGEFPDSIEPGQIIN